MSEHILPEQTSAVIDIDAEIDFKDITPKFFNELKRFNPFGPDNQKPVFCTHHVYDYGTSKVVGRDQEHIKLELVDNKSNNVMNGIAFEIEGYIARFRRENADICIIFTGGAAKNFAKRIKNAIFADCELVFLGLNRILEFNAEC